MTERHHDSPQDSRLSTADIARKEDERDFEDRDNDRDSNSEREGQRVEGMSDGSALMPLLPANEAESFRSRWDSIQAGFVDNPKTSVESADSLVAEVMKRMAEVFAEEREQLETQWQGEDGFSTEDLRVALHRYRSFFNRLLTLQ